MKYHRGVVDQPMVNVKRIERVVGTPAHLARAQQIADQTPTLVKDDANLVPLPTGSVLVTGWGATGVPLLAQKLTARGHAALAAPIDWEKAEADIATAVEQAKQHDTVLVTTSGAATNAAQQKLVAALQATGKPVLVVALGVPYDIAALPGTRSYLATYSSTPVALESVARLLDGAITPRGKL